MAYPCVFSEYRDLIAHPRTRTDKYRQDATAGSTLITLIAAFLSYFGDEECLAQLIDLKVRELQHCTLQLRIPDESSEEAIYAANDEHGVALCDLPLTVDGQEQVDTLDEAFKQEGAFDKFSAIATGYWPIVLAACHHYRLPVPPSSGGVSSPRLPWSERNMMSALQRHLASPDAMLEAHVRRCHAVLTQGLRPRRIIYLDTKYWIILRDVVSGVRTADPRLDLVTAVVFHRFL